MTETSDRPVVAYDHYSHDHALHATEEERVLRQTCPAAWSEGSGGFWVLSSYDSVTWALRYTSIALVNGFVSSKATFTPGAKVTAATGEDLIAVGPS
jgi:hypothetical protein